MAHTYEEVTRLGVLKADALNKALKALNGTAHRTEH